MKIVLATPPAEGSSCGLGMPPPLGLIYVAMAAQKALGDKINIVDAYSEGLNAEEVAARVLAHQPGIFGLSVMSTNINRGLKFLKIVKHAQPAVTAVLGGQHATLFDRLLLQRFLKRIWCSGGRGRNHSPNFVKLWEVTRASPDCLDYRIGTGAKLSRDSLR